MRKLLRKLIYLRWLITIVKKKLEISTLLDFSELRNIVQVLKIHKNFIISKPDKENECVLTNKSDYLEKMDVFICDSSKFYKLLGSAKV